MSKRKRRGARVGRGSLSVIACLLLGSAILRITTGADEAWGKAEEHFQAQPGTLQTSLAPEPVQTQECKTEGELEAMLQAFSAREEQLDEREAKLEERMSTLAIADREITARLAELRQIEAELSRTLAVADQAAERDIGQLVAVYENMKPKDAAALFEEMDPNFAAGFLARMQPEAAAGVLAGLSPNAAYTISVVLAGRNAEVPKE